MASVTRTTRSGMVRITKAASSGLTWMPSKISSTTTLGSSRNARTGPGSRCSSGGMALKICVAPVAPAPIAAFGSGVVSGGVTDRRQAVVGDHHSDRFHGAWQFGRNSRHSDRATGRGEQSGHDIGDRIGEQVRGMRTFEAVRQPWALEMDTGQVADPYLFGEHGDLAGIHLEG